MSGYKFNVRKVDMAVWGVYMGGTLIATRDSWDKCVEMVFFALYSYKKGDTLNFTGRIVRVLDYITFVVGVLLLAGVIYFSAWHVLAVPVTFLVVSIRGIILKDYYHVSPRDLEKKMYEQKLP